MNFTKNQHIFVVEIVIYQVIEYFPASSYVCMIKTIQSTNPTPYEHYFPLYFQKFALLGTGGGSRREVSRTELWNASRTYYTSLWAINNLITHLIHYLILLFLKALDEAITVN